MAKVTSKAGNKSAKTKNAKTAKTSKVNLVNKSKIKSSDSATIADKTGYSQSYVCNVIAGRRYNEMIVNAVNAITKRRK